MVRDEGLEKWIALEERVRVGVIIFSSVWFLSKKSNQSKIFFFKKTETGSNRLVSVRFFRPKTGSNWFGSVFQFDSVLAQFFSDLNLGLFWFDFFGFRLIKPKPN